MEIHRKTKVDILIFAYTNVNNSTNDLWSDVIARGQQQSYEYTLNLIWCKCFRWIGGIQPPNWELNINLTNYSTT
jgi:hypothetical protein